MQSIVIQVPNNSDALFLMQLAEKMGFSSFQLSPKESREIARRGLAKMIAERPQPAETAEPTMDEILEIVAETRQKRYEKQVAAAGH